MKTAKSKNGKRKQKPRARTRTISVQVTVVGIDSNYDPVTKAAWKYRIKTVYPHFARRGYAVARFDGTLARRYLVAPEVAKPHVDYVTGVGHGLDNLYTGDSGDLVFLVGAYGASEASRKIVHFLSCRTAVNLGPDFVVNGARAYFGYDENFTVEMKSANVFFECDSEIDKGFADGLTASQVYRRAYNLYTKRINRLKQAGSVYLAGTLELNRDHLCAPAKHARWGDDTARLG